METKCNMTIMNVFKIIKSVKKQSHFVRLITLLSTSSFCRYVYQKVVLKVSFLSHSVHPPSFISLLIKPVYSDSSEVSLKTSLSSSSLSLSSSYFGSLNTMRLATLRLLKLQSLCCGKFVE